MAGAQVHEQIQMNDQLNSVTSQGGSGGVLTNLDGAGVDSIASMPNSLAVLDLSSSSKLLELEGVGNQMSVEVIGSSMGGSFIGNIQHGAANPTSMLAAANKQGALDSTAKGMM